MGAHLRQDWPTSGLASVSTELGQDTASAAALNGAAVGLHTHRGRLKRRLFAGVAEGVLHHLSQPAAKGGNRQ